MKTKLLFFLFVAFLSNKINAQTTLVSGDIAVIYHLGETNSPPYGETANVDRLGLVLLRDITTGTIFKVTENGCIDGTALDTDEGIITFTAQTDLSAGTVIDILSANPNQAPLPVGVFSSPDGAVETSSATYSLAASGDQTIVYTGTETNPTYIYSAFFDGTSWDAPGTCAGGCSGTESVEPSTGVTFAYGSNATSDHDTNWYIGPTTFTTPAEALTAINNIANWAGESTNSGAADSAADVMEATGFTFTTLSSETFDLENSLVIYPNPSNGNITIKNANIALNNVTITDVNGRTVVTQDLNGITTDVNLNLGSTLSSGLYFMTIASKNESTIKKLIIE
ncbi:T9SS type A sorting domain-containing protein [Lacinutrix chionoecetis]